ncbi:MULTISPECIES: YfbU family protein [Dietzia]|uniref:YfbU family protein n=1 Tax=Dietzia TaxID=37914 RepID=UPI000366B7EF|nr:MULTISPECIES: YfbU family protein [Dietzia]EYT49283.1 hypothetical protein H483_0118420 [Dietzia sp. UCD-THP]MCT1434211.1 YfbU family protein [Dietzia maris]MCT1521244.1 YfbU family protein [Dietzia maris]
MAVLNIRVEDRVRDQLKELADDEGISLSEYVRNLVMEAVVPVREQQEARHGGEPPQETLRLIDRQILSMLHRILGRVLPEDANDVDGDLNYQLMRAQILEAGYTGEYWYATAGFQTELSHRDCDRVKDILDMFRVITYSIERLEKDGAEVDEELKGSLEFVGFDHNDPLEGQMASYVQFLMRDGRWTELGAQLERHDNGNSHHRVLEMYLRMLAEYRRIMDGRGRGFSRMDYFLSLDELQQIDEASVHPSSRKLKG